jgi:hypothetical protein
MAPIRSILLAAASAVAVGGVAAPACADVLVAQTRINASIYGGATYLVDFNGAAAGGTQFSFTTTVPNQRVAFFVNAECAVDGGPDKWIGVKIVVDPATDYSVVPPTNGDNAFCSGNGTTTGIGDMDGWVSAAAIGAHTFATPGVHVVEVWFEGGNDPMGNGPGSRIDDVSLVVMN